MSFLRPIRLHSALAYMEQSLQTPRFPCLSHAKYEKIGKCKLLGTLMKLRQVCFFFFKGEKEKRSTALLPNFEALYNRIPTNINTTICVNFFEVPSGFCQNDTKQILFALQVVDCAWDELVKIYTPSCLAAAVQREIEHLTHWEPFCHHPQ